MPSSSAPIEGRQQLILAILSGVVAVAFQAYAVLTAMPAAARELGQLDLYAWAFTSFVIAMLFATVLGGRLVDRSGAVPPLGLGLAVFVIGLVVAGFAPSMLWLLGSRVLQGLGAGVINVALMVLVAQVFSAGERPRIMTAFSFCWVVPSFVGPPISAWIAQTFGWPWVFWSTVPLLGVTVALGVRPAMAFARLHVREDEAHSSVPLWAAGAAALGVAMLQVAGQRLGPGEGDVSPAGGWALTLGVAAAAVGMLSVAIPKLAPARAAGFARGLQAVVGERAFQSGAFFAAESFLPLLLAEKHGFTLVWAGAVITGGAVGWTIGSWVQSRTWLRLRRDQIITLGAVIGVAGVGVLIVGAAVPGSHWLWIAAGQVVAGLGMGLAVASTSLATFTLSEAAVLGRNTSSLQVAEALGNSLITAAAGTVFVLLHAAGDPNRTYGSLLVVCIAVAALAVAASLRIGPVDNEVASR